MNLRNGVKQLLRMSGHAMVSTVHERLNGVESQLGDLQARVDALAEAEGALLQGNIRTLEDLKTLEGETRRLREDICALGDLKNLEAETRRLGDHVQWVLENELARQVSIETSDYEFANPEIGLMRFLYSYLPCRKALDIGANAGLVSEALLQAGYEVYAFEPLPEAYARLTQRIGPRNGFRAFPFALGSRECEAPLHVAADSSSDGRYGDASAYSSLAPHSMPEDLPFTGSTMVAVKTLEGLHRCGVLPEDVGLVKIDTEGFDLEVIRGMGERRYPVIAAEFWDAAIPFGRSGLLYTLDSLVNEMRSRDYHWHIVLYRVWGENRAAFYSNHGRSIPNSWGNAVFFRDYDIFAQAQAWCAATLPRTYFKPVPQKETQNAR